MAPASKPAPKTRKQPEPRDAPRPRRVAILGDGQMGLALAGVLTDGAGDVGISLWGHSHAEASELADSRLSPRLPDFRLAERVLVTGDDAEALDGADLVVSAIPTQFSRAVWERLGGLVPAHAGIVSVTKGIEVGTLRFPVEVIADALDEDSTAPTRPFAALSGPTIAGELAARRPATMVAASADEAFARCVQDLFGADYLRVYSTTDLVGVELAGAAKNVIAIAAGALDGLKAGFNAKSALLARGLAEIARLGAALGAQQDTFFGVAGVGDLATTCFCPSGRNRSCGEALAQGIALDDYLQSTTSIVEGVQTAKSLRELARRHEVDMPIADAVYSVLFERLDPREAITRLMLRPAKEERVG
jgi:glycerol-3-phosphate dehydrogenase (NAD(P)+)